jgi:hypothetical protein
MDELERAMISIRLREIDSAIQDARRGLLLLGHQSQPDEKRARELKLKRMVLHREVLARNPELIRVIRAQTLSEPVCRISARFEAAQAS